MRTIPNFLTLIRILLIPVLVVFFYLPFEHSRLVCAAVFAVASITDWLDGYLARSLNQISPLGKFLDPVADKLIVSVALVLLVSEHVFPYLAIPAAIIVGREVVISALREWMAELGKRASVAVSYIGKVKTALQMIAITLLLSYRPGDEIFGGIGYVMLYVAAVLTIWSMCLYLKAAWLEISKSDL